VLERDRLGAKFSIVVVAEGARPIHGSHSLVEAAHGGVAERLGGAGKACADEIERLTGKQTRYVVLGHLQRGGEPTAFDRALATRFGGKAVELIMRGNFGKMVANNPPDIVPIPIGDVVGKTRTVPLDYDLLLTARSIGVSFGD
jgi:6-phosphofructokinase 1